MQFAPITLKALKPKETDFEPQTLGEHVKKRRLELRLTQKQAAERLGVNPWTVLNWEKDHTEPPINSMPAIIRFLGYNPVPAPVSVSEKLKAARQHLGWSRKRYARELGIDSGTLRNWEEGAGVISRKHQRIVAKIIGSSDEEVIADAVPLRGGLRRQDRGSDHQ